jgi:uncharacterized iron-regulated membrane protein
VRTLALWLHRWVGLAIAVFVAVAGLTGSVLVFHDELEHSFASELFSVAPPRPGAVPLDALVLRERALAALPGAQIHGVHLRVPTDHALHLDIEPAVPGADDQAFVDPYTGRVLGTRRWGDLTQGTKNLVPFVFKLHYSLALGEVGGWLFGVAALLWTFDCFVGLYQTFPPVRGLASLGTASFWRGWGRAFWVTGARWLTRTLTWHRASGLWIWALLLVFAWSGVGLNLQAVYRPVMHATLGMGPDWLDVEGRTPSVGPVLPWAHAREAAEARLAELANAEGFAVIEPWRLRHEADLGVYQYRALSTLDVQRRYPDTTLWIDDRTGALVQWEPPTGGAAGTTVESWLFALHFAAVGGWPYRVVVMAVGGLVAALSATGVVLWAWKLGRRGRRVRHAEATGPAQARLSTSSTTSTG